MGFGANKAEKNHAKTIGEQVDADRSMKTSWTARINLKQILVVITLGWISFTSYSCYSLPAPFLPREAEKKGLTLFESGCIFSAYELVRLFMAPLCASIVSLSFFS